MFWECPQRPKEGRVAEPKCALQARLGWTDKGTFKDATKTLEWLTRTVDAVWKQRYGKSLREAPEEKCPVRRKEKDVDTNDDINGTESEDSSDE
jgi:hypothetical protein